MNTFFKAIVLGVAMVLGFTITSLTRNIAPSSFGPIVATAVSIIVIIVGAEVIDRYFPPRS